jgi:hypothetical protein
MRIAALNVVKGLAIRWVDHGPSLSALAGHRLVVDEIELHGAILRVKKPAMKAMRGLCVTCVAGSAPATFV